MAKLWKRRVVSALRWRALSAVVLLLCAGAWADGARVVDVYLFWREGCPHCERAIEFLRRVETEEPQARVHYFEVSRNAANRAALIAYADRRKLEDLAVPFAVVGDEIIIGWGGEEFTGSPLLALSKLPTWHYYAYLLLYIFVFMLDDLIVFVVAMKTLEVTGATTKYVRTSHLVGGVVLLAIGAMLLLRPELLAFG
jgi:hypothetical protein